MNYRIIESERLFKSKPKDYFTNLSLYSFTEYLPEVIYKTLFYTNELLISLLIIIKLDVTLHFYYIVEFRK